MHVANFLFKFIIAKYKTNEHCDKLYEKSNIGFEKNTPHIFPFIMFSFIYQFEIIILINIFIFEGL